MVRVLDRTVLRAAKRVFRCGDSVGFSCQLHRLRLSVNSRDLGWVMVSYPFLRVLETFI